MSFPPRLIIIGAQKAGTTTLAALLGQHPDMALGHKKEQHFYTAHWHEGFDWYRQHYTDTAVPWLIDASPSYTAGYRDKETGQPLPIAQRIADAVPDARLIYLMRDPVKRAWSSYWHDTRFGNQRRSPEEALTTESTYIRQGFYDEQLEAYLAAFPREHILLLLFEEFVGDQQGTVDRVCDFIGVSRLTLATGDSRKNAGFRYSPAMDMVRRLFPNDRAFANAISFVKRLVPRALRSSASRLVMQDIPAMSEGLKQDLAVIFEPHNRRLEAMTGLAFNWTRPS